MNYNNESQITAFENEVWAYYQLLKAKGWSSPEEGDTSSREALFWRQPNGKYGVAQIEAAWWGWKLCQESPAIHQYNRMLRHAAKQLIDACYDRQDNEKPPLKYTIPYGAVNYLHEALKGQVSVDGAVFTMAGQLIQGGKEHATVCMPGLMAVRVGEALLAAKPIKPLTASEINRLYLFLMVEENDGLTHERFRRAAAGVQKALGLVPTAEEPQQG